MSGKYAKKNSGGHRKTLIAVIMVLTALLAALIWVAASGVLDTEPEPTIPTQTQAATEHTKVDPPVSTPSTEVAGDVGIDDPQISQSKYLVLSSLYTSTVLNPDAKDEFAEDIASIEVTNTSDRFLLQAELMAQMSDGTTVTFLLQNLPAGGVAEAFDTRNRPLKDGVSCLGIQCVSEVYTDEDPILAGILVEKSAGGNRITNSGTTALTNLKVVYRCDMGGPYFGGIAYEITIESLDPGQSVEVTDSGLFGALTVVRVYQ